MLKSWLEAAQKTEWMRQTCGGKILHKGSVTGTADQNHGPWPGLILTTCMNCLTTGSPGEECRTYKIPSTRRIGNDGKNTRPGRSCWSFITTYISTPYLVCLRLLRCNTPTSNRCSLEQWPWLGMEAHSHWAVTATLALKHASETSGRLVRHIHLLGLINWFNRSDSTDLEWPLRILFPVSTQVILRLLVQRPHFKKHCAS